MPDSETPATPTPAVLMEGAGWTREAIDKVTWQRLKLQGERGNVIDVTGMALDVLGFHLVPDPEDRKVMAEHLGEALRHVLDEAEAAPVKTVTRLHIPGSNGHPG